MAIAAAHSLADYAEKRGITPDNIIPNMDEAAVFPTEAADVANAAMEDGVARVHMSWDEVFRKAEEDIKAARSLTQHLMDAGYIPRIPESMVEEALTWAVAQVSK